MRILYLIYNKHICVNETERNNRMYIYYFYLHDDIQQ